MVHIESEKILNKYRDILSKDFIGYECAGIGWLGLLDNALNNLQQEINTYFPGYVKITRINTIQGSMYIEVNDRASDKIIDIINNVYSETAYICEICGKSGSLVKFPNTKLITRCENCLLNNK